MPSQSVAFVLNGMPPNFCRKEPIQTETNLVCPHLAKGSDR